MYKLVSDPGFADERTECGAVSHLLRRVGRRAWAWLQEWMPFLCFSVYSFFLLWDFQHCILIIISPFFRLLPDPYPLHLYIALCSVNAAFVTLECGHPCGQPSVTKPSLARCRILWPPLLAGVWSGLSLHRSCACWHNHVIMALMERIFTYEPWCSYVKPWRVLQSQQTPHWDETSISSSWKWLVLDYLQEAAERS